MKTTDELRGQQPSNYIRHRLVAVATLGLRCRIFKSGPVVLEGPPGWSMHRNHIVAGPTGVWTIPMLADWLPALVFRRDVFLQSVHDPRRASITGGSPDVRR